MLKHYINIIVTLRKGGVKKYITLGDLIVFNSLMIYFFSPAKKLIMMQRDVQDAKVFSDSVDDIISARDQKAGFGIGTALFMTVYIALQFIPVANWIGDGALSLISLITGGGFFLNSANLAKEIYNYYMASQSANILFSNL